jgi:GntR family transcriptional regulator, transcriptional repressor for pyruvate dehydrogenase complex
VTSRTADAVHGIRSMILGGELRPGDRLPPEAELADRLQLSRSSLREAVRALSFIGVLRVRQGDGTYVTELDGTALLDNLGFVVDLASEQTLLEFFQLRRLLEPTATAMAAATMDHDQLAAVAGCLAIMERAEREGDRDAFIDADLGFHHTVCAVVGNSVLTGLLRALGLRSLRTHRWRARADEGALDRTLEEHRAILDALRRRDPEAARAAATTHLLGGERWVREVVNGEGPSMERSA